MALLIDGDAMTFRAAAYNRPHANTLNFLQQQFDDPSRALNLANQSFMERSRTIFEENYGEVAMARMEAVRRNLRGTWDLDVIQPLVTIEALQSARPAMQRWVMANPFLRRLYKEGRISGYGESYLDHKKQGIGPDHYDYCLATNGMATYNDEDDWLATTYGIELLEGDTEPTFEEKIDISKTWAAAEFHLLFGTRDVTSPENNPWG